MRRIISIISAGFMFASTLPVVDLRTMPLVLSSHPKKKKKKRKKKGGKKAATLVPFEVFHFRER